MLKTTRLERILYAGSIKKARKRYNDLLLADDFEGIEEFVDSKEFSKLPRVTMIEIAKDVRRDIEAHERCMNKLQKSIDTTESLDTTRYGGV